MTETTRTVVWCGVVAVLAAARGASGEPVALTGRAMGTTWAVKYLPATDAPDANEVGRRVADRLEALEQIYSTFRPNSELSRLNAAPTNTEWQPVSRELANLAIAAREISEGTNGAFDVTVGPLVALWGFGPAGSRAEMPTSAEIAATRLRVGWRNVEARAAPAALRRVVVGVTADFSSAGKGFASDEISALLAALGLRNHFVQVGGDVRTGGRGAAVEPWRVGIESPSSSAPAVACVVALEDEAVSTSGNYRNFVQIGARRFGHIIDPRTGAPVENDLVAVTVIHRSCMFSSGWATGLFVLGADEGLRIAEREHLACLFFVRAPQGTVVQRATPEFERMRR